MVETIAKIRQVSMLLAGLAVFTAISACTQQRELHETAARAENTSPSASPAASHASSHVEAAGVTLTPVTDRRLVCMVNNQYMGKPQIPVDVDGKIYYGCCPMCKERLATNPAARAAIDPASHKTVDKADAVIARTPSGSVLYFESAQTLAVYSGGKAP